MENETDAISAINDVEVASKKANDMMAAGNVADALKEFAQLGDKIDSAIQKLPESINS